MIRAAVLRAYDAPLEIESLELAEPRADEIVVKLAASGVCHTDLSVVQGKLPLPPPSVLGHEGAGVVESVGSGVTDLAPGDHVVLSWVRNCGKCAYCIAGTSHLCEGAIHDAMAGADFVFRNGDEPIGRLAGVGSFAEKTVIKASAAIKIANDIPLDRACLVGCGVMTGVGAAINTVNLRPGQTVAVFGCGGVGLNVLQGAALCSPAQLIAVDVSPAKLDTARTFGATDVLDASRVDDVPAAIKAMTGGLGVDWAFEASGVGKVIQQSFLSIKRGGSAVIVGVPSVFEEVALPSALFALEERSVIGSLYGSANIARDMPRLLDLYMRKRIKIDELISQRIRLDQVNEAFAAMQKGDVARSVIVYD